MDPAITTMTPPGRNVSRPQPANNIKIHPDPVPSFFFGLTIERRAIQTECPFATFLRDLLLQAPLLQVGQVGPLQVVHELELLIAGQHDVGAGLADHLEEEGTHVCLVFVSIDEPQCNKILQ